MEPSVRNFDDEEYEEMTYDERRNFNLARNKEMMNLLFAGGNPLSTNEDDVDKDCTSAPVLVDRISNEADAETLASNMITNRNIFCREKECLLLMQFLDKNLFQNQSMLLYGPVASGTALSQITSSATMTVSCTSVTSSKKLMQSMWLDALASISRFNKTQLNILSSFEEDSKIKNVSTFSDLVDRMTSLMFCQAHILKQVKTNKVSGLVVLIDHIDRADELEDGLSRRLMSLHEVGLPSLMLAPISISLSTMQLAHVNSACPSFDKLSHPMIKVLAVGRTLPHSLPADCMLLHLPPYSDQQLISIMCQQYDKEQGKITSLRSEFKALCEQALPHFTITTRQVNEIWTLTEELFARRCVGVSGHRHNSSLCSSSSSSSSCSNVLAPPVPSGSKRPLDEDINSLVLLPAVHLFFPSGRQGTVAPTPASLPVDVDSFHGKLWFAHLPLKTKALAVAAFLASRNPPATDQSTFGQASKGRRKKTRTDPDAAKATTGSQPQSFGVERLLSIYKQVFPSISASTANMPANKYRRHRNAASAGEVDKTVSIFSTVESLKQRHQNTKNEALLYTMINTLLKKRFVMAYSMAAAGTKAVKMADSNHHLLYMCTLPSRRAEELAQSIGFPLKDYLCV